MMACIWLARANGIRIQYPVTGVRALSEDVKVRIIEERESGSTLTAIADRLNIEDVATAQGGRRWWPSTVRTVLSQV
jgi:transposase-like protein